jgi:uncharacterized protein (TIGR02246 family)
MDLLQRIEAERACERLIARYAQAVNDWDLDTFVSLFTPDAVWQRPNVPPLNGHDEIRGFMNGQPSAGRTLRHVNGLCMVTLADDGLSATSISQTTVYDTARSGPLPVPLAGPDLVVEYRDMLIRQDGAWRFARRDTTVVFSVHV